MSVATGSKTARPPWGILVFEAWAPTLSWASLSFQWVIRPRVLHTPDISSVHDLGAEFPWPHPAWGTSPGVLLHNSPELQSLLESREGSCSSEFPRHQGSGNSEGKERRQNPLDWNRGKPPLWQRNVLVQSSVVILKFKLTSKTSWVLRHTSSANPMFLIMSVSSKDCCHQLVLKNWKGRSRGSCPRQSELWGWKGRQNAGLAQQYLEEQNKNQICR